MNNYFVYILLCADGTYYVGVTNDVDRRLREHQAGLSQGSYTAKRLPVELKSVTHFSNIIKAIEFEKKIKKWSKVKKKVYIDEQFKLLPALSKKKFYTKSIIKTI